MLGGGAAAGPAGERREDADALLDAAATVIVFGFLEDKSRRQPRKLVRDYLRSVERSGDGAVVLAIDGAGDVSCALTLALNVSGAVANVDPAGAPPAPEDQPYLANLCTAARARRGGLAREVVRRAVAVAGGAARPGGDGLYLHTDEGSAAHQLFLSEGFAEVGGGGGGSPLAGLFGRRPRLLLMRRPLAR